ncbi:MAG: AI-2E family transporter [Herpetosiphonaceae bacterium]|nr:MAG: AI-2E family transporter [Herpetosiphonaceae bacterium]
MSAKELQEAGAGRHNWTWQRVARIGLILVALYVLGWLLSRAWNDLVPFIVGLILAYLLSPLVRRLSYWMPKWLAILVVYVIGFGAIIITVLLVVPPAIRQVQEFATNIPSWYRESLEPLAEDWLIWYERNIPENVQETVSEQIQRAQETLKANAAEYASRVTSGVLNAVTGIFRTVIFLLGFLIIPFWLFYVLKDQEQGKVVINKLIPEEIRADFWAVVQIIDRIFSSYIRGQLLLGGIVAILSFVGLTILNLIGININYILLLSLIAGATELIPVIGPILGAIPAIIVGFATAGMTGGLAVTAVYVVVQQVENNVLVPRIIGGAIEIHPAVLMVLLVIAGAIWGLIGVILVAPVAAVARDVFLYLYQRLKETDPSAPKPERVETPKEKEEVVPQPEQAPQPEQVSVSEEA